MPSSGAPGRRSACASGDARDRSPSSAGSSSASAPVRRKKHSDLKIQLHHQLCIERQEYLHGENCAAKITIELL